MWTINQKCVFGLVVGCFALPFCNSVLIGKHIWSLVFLIQVKTGAISKYRTYQVKLPPPVIKSDYESFLIYRVKLPPPTLNKCRRRKKKYQKIWFEGFSKDFWNFGKWVRKSTEKVRKMYGYGYGYGVRNENTISGTGTGAGTGAFRNWVRNEVRSTGCFELRST